MPLVLGGAFLILGLPIVKALRRLPPPRPVPPLPQLSGIADLSPVTLDVVTPRLNIIFEGLIVVAATVAMLFLPRELNPAQRKLPLIRHELVLVTLVTMFVAYHLIAHAMELFRLVRSVWLERHLAKRALIGRGRIIESDSETIKYEFLDYSSRLLRGAGRDYTIGLYEDMPVTVLYDPDDPALNMPVVALQFHRQHDAMMSQLQAVPADKQ